ncbi:error-prone DNA polymerase [Idiomarina aquatica]|uniref:Error-prone DNA polymerase n=1 Tax=Idiomarina aquatica TaxID=1327752 RepID=A0AA94EHK6_9GAMM|nr:error-prone DNA polymerase [Idiomarina aquatica]RUO45716.1 error-prone DNA polymerase [Idiomarina aquatica]
MRYAELHCLSNFSFLRAAAFPAELVDKAAELGYEAIAITDECSVAGIVRAYEAARNQSIKLIVGSEFHVAELGVLVVICPSRKGYAQLCRKITEFRGRAVKGDYQALAEDFLNGFEDCFLLWLPQAKRGGISYAKALNFGHQLKRYWRQRFWLLYERHYHHDDKDQFRFIQRLSQQLQVKVVAAGGCLLHEASRQPLLDIVTAIAHGESLLAHPEHASINGEQRLRSLTELQQCYPPDWLQESVNIAEQCHFSMSELRYEYPAELVPAGLTASDYLRQLTEAGARKRYPAGVPDHVVAQYEKELQLIEEQRYEYFFLTIHDLVRFAQQHNIFYQGRGSAANSVVCYCLEITAVNPAQIEVLFERFISKERDEPPDIDVDFEHERREEVIQYIYRKYGRSRAALAATVIRYRFRSAFRDVGKALGFSEQQLQHFRQQLDRRDKGVDWKQQLKQQHPQLVASRRGQQLLKYTEQLMGFPRHLSQHVGGFVIAAGSLTELVPIENASMPDRTVIQWDKDDLETLKLLKVDVLALGMLTAIRKTLQLLEQQNIRLSLAEIPQEDIKVYQTLQKGDSVGVFQIESRAQMNMLPRLKPATFYDLVIQIAIVRPGPIQGDMVHPYLRRRAGQEAIDYPSEEVRSVLQRTLGVPIFQEQAIKLAMVAAGFSGGQADQLRRAMASWHSTGKLKQFEHKLINGMLARGYSETFAQRLFQQICGFGQYGFPESHSASFANLAYASAWLKIHYPSAFYTGLLNSLPMGFYSPSQLVQDAKRHGVKFLPADINQSHWDYQWLAAQGQVIRVGLRQVAGLAKSRTLAAIEQRGDGFKTIEALRQAGLFESDIEALAKADALKSISGHRYQASWDALMMSDEQLPLFSTVQENYDKTPFKPNEQEDIGFDYASMGLSLRRHPLALIREHIELKGCITADALLHGRSGSLIEVAGLVTCRQRPGTKSGVTFFTLEDETGNINVVVWATIARKYRKAFLSSRLVKVKGVLESHQGVVHVIAQRLEDKTDLLSIKRHHERRFH